MARARGKEAYAVPAKPAVRLPRSHLDRLGAAGFHVHFWRDVAVMVEDGERSEWLPRLAFAPMPDGRGYRVIEWRRASDNGYAFDGWSVSQNHYNGGAYIDIHGALDWFDWLYRQLNESLLQP